MSETYKTPPTIENKPKTGWGKFVDFLIQGFADVAPLYGNYADGMPPSEILKPEKKNKE